MVKIFCLEFDSELKKEVFDFLLSVCSEDKKNQILNKRIKKDRERSVLGNALAKYAIKNVFSVPVRNQTFCYSENGKPYLSEYQNIYFSISHSGNLIVCAVSDNPVGIDVQEKRKYNKMLGAMLNARDSEEFFSVWTKTEAVIKKMGSRISKENLKKTDISKAKAFKYKNYFIGISE